MLNELLCKLIQKVVSKKATKPEMSVLLPGAVVSATHIHWMDGEKKRYYHGVIDKKVENNDAYNISFYDGDKKHNLPREYIRPITPVIGSVVLAKKESWNKNYLGVVDREIGHNGERKMTGIKFFDGEIADIPQHFVNVIVPSNQAKLNASILDNLGKDDQEEFATWGKIAPSWMGKVC